MVEEGDPLHSQPMVRIVEDVMKRHLVQTQWLFRASDPIRGVSVEEEMLALLSIDDELQEVLQRLQRHQFTQQQIIQVLRLSQA
jgi:hypothetical protein